MGIILDLLTGKVSLSSEEDSSNHHSQTVDGTITYDDILYSEPDRFALRTIDMTTKPFAEQSRDGDEVIMGLMPHELLYLFFCELPHLDSDENLSYFGYQYGMEKAEYRMMVSKLKDSGFIHYADIQDCINVHTIPEIKTVLKKHGLTVSGKKQVIVERLLQNVERDLLELEFPAKYFCLTGKGRAAISNSRQILYAHRKNCDSITIWTVSKIISSASTDEECAPPIFDFLEKRAHVLESKSLFGMARNCRSKQYQISSEVGDYDKAFKSLARVLYSDLSGVDNNYNRELLHIYAQYWFPYENSMIRIPPALKTWLRSLQESLEYSDCELTKQLIEEMGVIRLPFNVFSPEECADICLYELRDNTEALDDIYSKKRIALKKQFPDLKL